MAEKLNGQWIGKFTGATGGSIHVNIDEDEANYRGVAYLFNDEQSLPPAVAYFSTPDKSDAFAFRTEMIHAIDRSSGAAVPWEQVREKYPKEVTFSKFAEVKGAVDGGSLTLSWTTDAGVNGECVLPRSKAGQPSELVALNQDWETYKKHVLRLAPERPLFRGQNRPWRLRTPFHRTGRADLNLFLYRDIPALHRHLSARTRHVFKLTDQDEFGAFLSLLQHHGYPTPMLDWTYSPFVAVFFAYRGIASKAADTADKDAKVRILIFNSAEWTRKWKAVPMLVSPQLHVTVREFSAIENERLIPQQAASTVTSVDDVETYLRGRDTDTVTYLQAIDLPVRERQQVMRELSYMGITAGSLFPGLDGACEEMTERNFRFQEGEW